MLFCRSTQQSYLQLLTTAQVLAPYGIAPLSNAAAWTAYAGWFDSGCVVFMNEPRGLDSYWEKLAVSETPSPKVWMDAYLAAFAVSGGYQLVTTDQGFRQIGCLDALTENRKLPNAPRQGGNLTVAFHDFRARRR